MQEAPHPAILNRDEAIQVAQKHFSGQLALLQDLANYGSNLVVRAYDSSPKKMAEVVVCGVLLKQIVAMVDAVEVLLSSGCSHAAYPSTLRLLNQHCRFRYARRPHSQSWRPNSPRE